MDTVPATSDVFPRYTRSFLLSIRRTTTSRSINLELLSTAGLLHYRGTRAGLHVRNNRQRKIVNSISLDYNQFPSHIPVVISRRSRHGADKQKNQVRIPCRKTVLLAPRTVNKSEQIRTTNIKVPSIYLLNPTSIAKPHAIQHLYSDISSNSFDVVILAETWLKTQHSDSIVAMDGYTLFRRDRKKRKGGGVAIYLRSQFQGHIIDHSNLYADSIELLWVNFIYSGRNCCVGAIYHPPKPLYKPEDVQHALECSLDDISVGLDDPLVILGGDFNQLPASFVTSLGLQAEFDGPSHGNNCLDRIYTSEHVYDCCRAVESTVSTKHKAVIAADNQDQIYLRKTFSVVQYRRRTPSLHASFLNHVKSESWDDILNCLDTNLAFDLFYDKINLLLNRFYPQKSITLSSRDPPFINAEIKFLLRKKNKLVRKNKIEAANAISQTIRNKITKINSATFSNPCKGPKELWDKVNKITGRTDQNNTNIYNDFTADQLNEHYSRISTDSDYEQPIRKQTVNSYVEIASSEMTFYLLDRLKNTAAGADGLPSWFLRLAAPAICSPVAHLFNLSISFSVIPKHWKTSIITPRPKVKPPLSCSDFRPISVTPILSRLLEKVIVHNFFNPILVHPSTSHLFSDQFAFRPTGSTTSALIYLLHHVSDLLQHHPYVHIVALDFSKAFDTVRHGALTIKLQDFPLSDNIYNWIVDYLADRQHLTLFRDVFSKLASINASIIQGSGFGPSAYIFTASDLQPLYSHNLFAKYADDTYLIVPASYTNTITSELQAISDWATRNNLKLNESKTQVMIVRRPRFPVSDLPPPILGLHYVTSLKVLGVYFSEKLDFSTHVNNIVSKIARSMYALRVLKAHGLQGPQLWEVTQATAVSHLIYASPAWQGFLDFSSRQRLQSVLSKLIKQGLLSTQTQTLDQILSHNDTLLFRSVLSNQNHVLHQLLPPIKFTPYNLRLRDHNRILPIADDRFKKNFIIRMLFK